MSEPLVEVVGPEPNGLASMLGAIAQSNLARHPQRARHLQEPGVIQITAADAEVTVKLELGGGRLRVYSGADAGPRPHVSITADAATLTGFSSVPQLGPIPDPFQPKGRDMWMKLLTGKVKLRGAIAHGALLQRLRPLLAVD